MKKDATGNSGTNNCSTSCFDSEFMLSKMRELSEKMQSIPNILVTTKRTFGQMKQAIESQEQQYFVGAIPSLPSTVYGMRIEEYETVKECLDRMENQRSGERIKLALSEEIPFDCIDHPWMKKQVREMAERLGYDWMFFKEALDAIPTTPEAVATEELRQQREGASELPESLRDASKVLERIKQMD